MAGELSNPIPGYLSNYEGKDAYDRVASFAKPARIKVVQALTKPPIKPPFKEGDIVINPQLIKIGDNENTFSFTPITFFPSWSCLNPIQMQGQLPAVREMTFDPNSLCAKKAIKFTQEPCPENPKFMIKYNQMLNFFVVVHQVEVASFPVILLFVRGEYKTGQNLIGFIQSRKLQSPKVPIFAHRYCAYSEQHTSPSGTWQGLNIANDPEPWVDEVTFRKNEALSIELEKIIEARAIDMSEFSEEEVASVPDNQF